MPARTTRQPVSIVDALVGEVKEVAGAPLTFQQPRQWVRLLDTLPLLRQLPAVPHEAAARSQVFAIKDALRQTLDQLDDQETSSAASEFQAVRRLLGLTPGTEGKSVPDRQRSAGELFGRSDRWVRDARDHWLRDLAVELAKDLPQDVYETDPLPSSDFIVHPDQRTARDWLTAYIRQVEPDNAEMLLHSSVVARPVLSALREVGSEVRLLLCHPASAFNEFQKRRIEINALEIREDELSGYDRVQARWYHTPSSLRGWHIGDYVGLSWYTYHDDKSLSVDHPNQVGVHSQSNPIIVGHVASDAGGRLAKWFADEFEELWDHRLTAADEDLYPGRGHPGPA